MKKSGTKQDTRLVIPLKELGREDVGLCGGKSSSLGEMIQNLTKLGIRVPGGFSTTAHAYQAFLRGNGLFDKIHDLLDATNPDSLTAIAKAGQEIRSWIMDADFSEEFIEAITDQQAKLVVSGVRSVAVRSSATAEDLPDASFAGQQETILGVPVKQNPVLRSIKQVIASLFDDRAISYRVENGFDHRLVSLCDCVQQMVRSDKACAGVMFTTDSETGHKGVIGITAVWGLGDLAVGGSNADEYIVGKPIVEGGELSILLRHKGDMRDKLVFAPRSTDEHRSFTEKKATSKRERSSFCLNDEQLRELAGFALIIERHYGCPMDIEWAMDGFTRKIYILQARPITVNKKVGTHIESYLLEKGQWAKQGSGLAVGRRIASGTVKILQDSSPEELGKVRRGDIIIARMTDPNYVPAMRLASAIVTEQGSSKCHAAIIAREMGKPAIVACANALSVFYDGQEITVSCAEGTTGNIYGDLVPFKVKRTKIGNLPEIGVKLKMNVGDPGQALVSAMFPNKGVGLARQEFIITNSICIHPQACIDYHKLSPALRQEVRRKTMGYKNPVDFYIRKLAEGIAMIARAFHPERVIIRLSDFKTKEYRGLIGGARYEPQEENPMLGFRGAARYIDPKFRQCFEMECTALRIVREEMELTNFDIMVPFIRTLQEGEKVKRMLAKNGLVSSLGDDGLRIGMMCELPSNVILAKQFAQIYDFASIGSNDLTQLVLGADRDSGYNYGDESDPAVKQEIERAVAAWHKAGKPIGICGQAPSQIKGYAEWLASIGIDSMSLIPDSVVPVWRRLAKAQENALKIKAA